MSIRIIKIFILLLASCSLAMGKTALEEEFAQANRLYRAEKYAEAASAYVMILKSGYESGELHYNLGNAYFKSGRLGKSILHYEWAKRMLPRDEDIFANLNMAQMRVADKIEVPRLPIWKSIDALSDYLALDGWAKLTWCFYIVGLLLSAWYYIQPRGALKRLVFYLCSIVLMTFLLSAAFFGMKLWHKHYLREAIIMEEKVEIVSAPDQGAKGLFALHEGVKVMIRQELPPWAEIALPDGKKGWVAKEVLEEI